MTLIRWNPVREIAGWQPAGGFAGELIAMQREIDRMFDRFRGGAQDDEGGWFMPVVDIAERKHDYRITVELPGVKKEDVKITVENGTLTVRGEKKSEEGGEGEGFRRTERSYGTFQRSFTLPTSVRIDKIDASYEAGILTLLIPKAEESKAKEIAVK